MTFPEYAVDDAAEDEATTVYKIDLVDGIPTVEIIAAFEDRETAIDFCDTWRGKERPTD